MTDSPYHLQRVAHGAALVAFAAVLRTQSARMEEKIRKQAEAYARCSGLSESLSEEELANIIRASFI